MTSEMRKRMLSLLVRDTRCTCGSKYIIVQAKDFSVFHANIEAMCQAGHTERGTIRLVSTRK